jgi:hypothetical protein
LEDLTTPTILFPPQFGAEIAVDGGGMTLQKPPVFLIFWGSAWSNPKGPTALQIEKATQNLLSSPYIDGAS